MARRPIDPARLSGEALTQWYLRTPTEVARERNEAEAQRWQDYQLETDRQLRRVEQGGNASRPPPSHDDLYIATGSGEWRPLDRDPFGTQDDGQPSFMPQSRNKAPS